jgi:DNA-binding transcriptional LysR family regulator
VRVWLETLLVSIAVAGLFGFLGLATVDAELTREWSGQAAVPLLHSSTILGEELVVTAALLQVAGFLGALAALMFALEVLVDEQSRHEAAHGTLDRDAEPAGDVRVAGFASLLTGPTLQAIRELSARHPRLTISLQEREPREVDTMLADDAIDVGFVYDYSLVPRYHPDQEAVRLLAEKPMALLVPAHRRAGPFEQPARTLGSAQATWITNSRGTDDDELLHRVTAAHGAIARVAHRIDSLGLITELVAAGLGVGLMVADGPTHPGVSYVDLDGAAGSRRIYACTRPGRPHWRNNAAVITAVAAALARQPAPS